jgi:hypothetical protein
VREERTDGLPAIGAVLGDEHARTGRRWRRRGAFVMTAQESEEPAALFTDPRNGIRAIGGREMSIRQSSGQPDDGCDSDPRIAAQRRELFGSLS